MIKYWYTKEVKTGFYETLDDIEISLKKQWFWILTRIDMQDAMKNKLWKNIEKYMVLWTCNPWFAFEAMQVEKEIGLIMPCNIIIYEKDSKVFVSGIIASIWIWFINNPKIKSIAEKIDIKLKVAIDNI